MVYHQVAGRVAGQAVKVGIHYGRRLRFCEGKGVTHYQSSCRGFLWRCTCGRWTCLAEGNADNHHELCDICWYDKVGKDLQ